ncbi:MAG: sulfotransferase [Chloroflexi bacterium]|nr:sulfotransferase [Chloroflexota bacterium]
MGNYLVTPDQKPYTGFDFSNWFGGEYYWNRLESFCDEMAHGEFHGRTWQQFGLDEGRILRWAKRLDAFKRQALGQKPLPDPDSLSVQLKTAKYFPDRKELAGIAADFVDDLFLHAAHEAGKQTWCEKTPQHVLHLDFLAELFPDAVFVHIKRDPRGVAFSLTKQPWAPSDLKNSSLLLRNVYHRWINLKAGLDWSGIRYIEVKLEDLAMAPDLWMGKIAAVCNIQNNFPGMPDVDIDKVDYWRTTMSDEDCQAVNGILGSFIEEMGYAL